MTDLKNRTAIVTGASRGIGPRTARALALAKEGATVVPGPRSAEALERPMSEPPASSESAPPTTGTTIRSWARWYDSVSWVMSLGRGGIRRDALEAVGLSEGETLLDIGCGTGTLALQACDIVREAGRVVGVDASPEMIAVARKKVARQGRTVDLRVAAAEALPFTDAEFDCVVSTFVFHHLPNELRRDVLREVYRVLRPGGRVAIVDFAGGGGPALHRMLALILGGHTDAAPTELTQELERAGFMEVRQTENRGIAFALADRPAD